LPLLLLSLLPRLLLSRNMRGDCGPPPEIPNATPELDGKTSFPQQSFVVYSCNKDYQKIPGKQDTLICLENGQWSSPDTFCNKSCNAPTRVIFASLKKKYIYFSYFPIGSTVEYECRPGYRRVPSLSDTSTCLDNLEWSTVAEFCERESCPHPGELQNGNIDITTDILFGSEIFFSCNTGYKLIGVDSAFCYFTGSTLDWTDPLPECAEIHCPDPPPIKNGEMRGGSKTYVYRHTVTYTCAIGFVLVGNSSIHCTLNGDQGEWSGPAPQCTEILCPDPPPIKNGEMQGESKTYVYRHTVTYTCATGFVLVGNSSIYCTLNGDQGEWSGPAPQCTGQYYVLVALSMLGLVHWVVLA
ncbi:complement decay-accelerating factor-like, partial [Chionomys nivalis]|uniref:complement decay-accelerating factor-like n=1 Tax=Chionomys nivalis TaxID=269649 RepID=UPI002596CE0E